MDDVKTYTLDEANALLPYLAPTLIDLRDKVDRARAARDSIDTAGAGEGIAELKAKEARLMEKVDALLGRLTEWGVILRDVQSGLVDFPATTHGEVLYCWKLGESEVGHWHSGEDGFAGRRDIADS